VTKKQIVQMISDKTGLTQLQTKDIVDLTFEAIVNTLLEEGRIELRNFGVFEVKHRKARKARNPRTSEKVDVPPKNVVTFKPGKEMEEKVRKLKKIPRPTVRRRVEDDGVAPPSPTKAVPNGTTPKPAASPAKPRASKPRKTT
jgi:integration host factor subunit beta